MMLRFLNWSPGTRAQIDHKRPKVDRGMMIVIETLLRRKINGQVNTDISSSISERNYWFDRRPNLKIYLKFKDGY